MYTYVRNNPLSLVDPDGLELIIAPKLQQRYDDLAAKSEVFRDELAAEKRDPNMRVVVVERGLRQNDEKSFGDTTVKRTESGYMFATVYVDAFRTTDSTATHELGTSRMRARTRRSFSRTQRRLRKTRVVRTLRLTMIDQKRSAPMNSAIGFNRI